ncbi:MAG: hypothetical protein HY364_01120 [Candidatus Aenigmarchaeota archaeon]|nr:hypothetical protein [Candidatus Aenigmarchaeota archaeon]
MRTLKDSDKTTPYLMRPLAMQLIGDWGNERVHIICIDNTGFSAFENGLGPALEENGYKDRRNFSYGTMDMSMYQDKNGLRRIPTDANTFNRVISGANRYVFLDKIRGGTGMFSAVHDVMEKMRHEEVPYANIQLVGIIDNVGIAHRALAAPENLTNYHGLGRYETLIPGHDTPVVRYIRDSKNQPWHKYLSRPEILSRLGDSLAPYPRDFAPPYSIETENGFQWVMDDAMLYMGIKG